MTKLFVRHTVADFNKWKVVFDEIEPLRKSFGSTAVHIYRGHSNPNELLVVTDWENKTNGLKFVQSPELKKGMEKGGVIGAPEINFSE